MLYLQPIPPTKQMKKMKVVFVEQIKLLILIWLSVKRPSGYEPGDTITRIDLSLNLSE